MRLVSVAIVGYGVRQLVVYFLARSSEFEHLKKRPALLDLGSVTGSPATPILQFLSMLLTGDAEILVLLYMPLGYSTWAEFGRGEPKGSS